MVVTVEEFGDLKTTVQEQDSGQREVIDKLISMMSYLKEGLEKLSVKPNHEPWDKDEDAVGESSEAGDGGTPGAATEVFSIEPTAI